ncbi:MAG: CBS domain-containing protein [Desulfobaccales bacterium]
MEFKETNREMMTVYFATIKEDAPLKEAYEAIKKNLEGPPHTPGLVVVDQAGKYAGLFTVDDLMRELAGLYRQGCEQAGKEGGSERFFSRCELVGLKQVADIMSGKRVAVQAGDSFAKACDSILYKNLNLVAVVDESLKPVGIITRRKVLVEITPRMFH